MGEDLTVEDAGLSCPVLTPEELRRVLGRPVPVTAFNSAI